MTHGVRVLRSGTEFAYTRAQEGMKMSDKDREDVEVKSQGDAWPIVPNPSTYDVIKDGEKVGETPAWDKDQAQDKAEKGDYRPTK